LSEYIGEYFCPNCGLVRISDPTCVTIRYPITLQPPEAKIDCSCGYSIVSAVEFAEAIMFEKRGATVEGFKFATAIDITEDEIGDFMGNFEDEMREFLNACS